MKIAIVLLVLVCAPVSHAQDGDALAEIRAEMARLREENARIRGELDRMNRARDPELDRLMRAQIGMAVDAAMAQVQSEKQMTAGWNDGFFLACLRLLFLRYWFFEGLLCFYDLTFYIVGLLPFHIETD